MSIDVQGKSLQELKKMFDERIFAIPEIQREFVWTKRKIIDFLDSVRKDYPIGSILICKINAQQSNNIRESPVLPRFDKRNKECYLVIDGQQRLSVLFSILTGQTIITTRSYTKGINFGDICFSPKKDSITDSEFGFYNADDSHTRLHDVLQNNKSVQFGMNKRMIERIKSTQKAYESYIFPFIILHEYDKKRMREAFIRLNRGGTTLSAEDKIFAISYNKETDIRRHSSQLALELTNGFNSFSKIIFIKSIAANLGLKDFVSNSSLDLFARRIRLNGDIYHIDYKRENERIYHSIKLAADFLGRWCGHASYIPYPSMLSILSVFYYANKNQEPGASQIKQIRRWFWLTGFTKRYSGSNQRNNQINDSEEMKRLAKKGNHRLDLEKGARIEPFSIRSLYKVKYNTSGAVKNSFFCYLMSKRPLHFQNGLPLVIGEMSSIFNTKNDHHIFPKKILKAYYPVDKINSVLNICFLTFNENIGIGANLPWVYLTEYKRFRHFRDVLNSHTIPFSDSVLKKGNIETKFKQFQDERLRIIRGDLLKMLGAEFVED